jgi:hypothetical protein
MDRCVPDRPKSSRDEQLGMERVFSNDALMGVAVTLPALNIRFQMLTRLGRQATGRHISLPSAFWSVYPDRPLRLEMGVSYGR